MYVCESVRFILVCNLREKKIEQEIISKDDVSK